MWTTVVLATALSLVPSAADSLTLSNIRSTQGAMGPLRTENKLLPGDLYVVAFDIEGIKVADDGKVLYSISLEVANRQGRVVFTQEPRNQEAINSLGGKRLPAYAMVNLGLDLAPDTYTVKVVVTDRASSSSQSFTRTVEVLPRGFGLVRVATTSDPDGQIPTPLFGEGQSLWINFAAVEFARDTTTQQPNLTVTMRVLDESGEPTVKVPFTGTVTKDISPKALAVPMRFLVALNQAGKYRVELEATDQVSKKTSKMSFPLTVVKAN